MASVATDHLVALDEAASGEALLFSADETPETVDVARLAVGLSGREGASHPVACRISWPGPIALGLDGEATVQAACGLMHVHGRRSGTPEPLGVDYASVATGVVAAQGILAALIGRLRGIEITEVETSVAQTALLTMGQYLAVATSGSDRSPTWRPGGPPFRSADGVRFEIEALDPNGWSDLWRKLGAPPEAVAEGWHSFVTRFATASCPLPEDLHRTVADHAFTACREAARAAGISILRLRSPTESKLRWSRGAAPWTLTPLHDPRERARPQRVRGVSGSRARTGCPLEGLVVVEAGRRLQGPLAAHVLGLLGARIVRIEPPGGDLQRGMEPLAGDCSARFLAVNRGKEVVELDLKSTGGRESLRELIADADVFMHNWAPGRASQRGMDGETLAAIQPALVTVHASGWSGTLGPDPPLGTDYMAQAHSGLAALVRPPGEPPAPSLMTITDILGGLVAAEGALGGLLLRLLTGQGQRVESSLLSAAMVAVRSALGGPAPTVARPRWGPLHRPLPTADGHLALSDRARNQPARVAAALGLDGGSPARATFTAATRRSSSTALRERLGCEGLNSVEVYTDLAALAADDRFAAAFEHGACTFVRAPWRFHP